MDRAWFSSVTAPAKANWPARRALSFFSSLLILLREGLEAILVLAAILAFLNKTGQQHATRSVHVGWGLALVAGFVTWAVAALLLDISGAQRELLEGGTALFASVMLLWLGVWMHGRRQADAWQAYLRQSMLGSGGRFGFALLAATVLTGVLQILAGVLKLGALMRFVSRSVITVVGVMTVP